MKFFVKNKFGSLGGSSKVYDENGTNLFKVKGKVFSFTRKKKIFDMDGKLLFIVKNKFINWWAHTSFIFDGEKQKIASVKNRVFKGGYDVVGYTDEIALDGWGLKGYTVLKNGKKVGSVKSNIMALTDTYEVEVDDEQDIAFMVAIIVAMDNVNDKSKR